jgi:hypothetical protein
MTVADACWLLAWDGPKCSAQYCVILLHSFSKAPRVNETEYKHIVGSLSADALGQSLVESNTPCLQICTPLAPPWGGRGAVLRLQGPFVPQPPHQCSARVQYVAWSSSLAKILLI